MIVDTIAVDNDDDDDDDGINGHSRARLKSVISIGVIYINDTL